MYFSQITDGFNHAYSKAHAMNQFMFFRLNKLLIQFIRFYEKHFPDTVIFGSSDHGGQYFNGEDNFCNHGCVGEKNQGMFFVHVPGRKGLGRIGEVSYIDIAPTIAQFLDGT